MNLSSQQIVDEFIGGANRLADLGDKVAAFAILQNLAAAFLVLKDLRWWAQHNSPGFFIGISIGVAAYVSAVIWIAYEEASLRALVVGATNERLATLRRRLLAGRIIGIVLAGVVLMFGVLGAIHSPPAMPS